MNPSLSMFLKYIFRSMCYSYELGLDVVQSTEHASELYYYVHIATSFESNELALQLKTL